MIYNLQTQIPYHVLEEDSNYVEHAIESLKRRGAEEVFSEIYNINHPVVVETHIEAWDDPTGMIRNYKLHYRLTAVQQRNVVMPVFTFTNHSGKLEWKCPACSIINDIEATFCGEKHHNAVGCGRPRERTRQEYENQYMGAWNV